MLAQPRRRRAPSQHGRLRAREFSGASVPQPRSEKQEARRAPPAARRLPPAAAARAEPAPPDAPLTHRSPRGRRDPPRPAGHPLGTRGPPASVLFPSLRNYLVFAFLPLLASQVILIKRKLPDRNFWAACRLRPHPLRPLVLSQLGVRQSPRKFWGFLGGVVLFLFFKEKKLLIPNLSFDS